jgi:translocation and assembly module TamB
MPIAKNPSHRAAARVARFERRSRPPAWDRRIAQALCMVLAFVGLLPFLTAFVVRSAWARSFAARTTQRLIAEHGVVAHYEPAFRIWPMAIELDRARVESNDGGAPVLEAARILVRPRLFALLAGKLAIDQIDLDSPRVRAVVREGKLVNLALPSNDAPSGGPLHAPFDTFSVTDASVDLDVDGIRVGASGIDADATAEDDPRRGSSLEVALRIGHAAVHRRRTRADGTTAEDDDVLCSTDGRVRIDPDAVLVRRFEATAVADFDGAPDTTPSCEASEDDPRRVAVSLGHLRVRLPGPALPRPTVDGHVRVRVPIPLVERVAQTAPLGGWAGADLDVRYGADSVLPDLGGTIEAHGVRLGQFSFAHELHSELTVRGNVVRSPTTTVRIANGLVTLSDTVVEPLAHGGHLEHTRLDATNVDFTALMRDLGVHQSSWVGWDVRELHVPSLSGSFAPLHIDGQMAVQSYTFGVYDRPAEDKSRERLFGFSEAKVNARVAIRAEALKFLDVQATLPHSYVEGGQVSLGFDNNLRIEAPRVHADLDDLSPIGPVPMHGIADISADVGGVYVRPTPRGDIHSATNLVIADVAFGDLTAGHVEVDTTHPDVQLTNVHARRRNSPYEVTTARLDFGGSAGFVVDAESTSDALGLRDLLSMFALDEDPRFDGLDATAALRATVHVAAGGPEDACGSGFVSVGAKTHLRNVALYGERFAQGDADVALRWYDRAHGIAGADVDVSSFVLDKVQPPVGTRAGAIGTVLGSATMRRGGALAANLSVENLPLGRLDSLGELAHDVEGSLSGVAHVTGQLDDFLPDAGFVVRAQLDADATRVRGVAMQPSHLDVELTDRMRQQHKSYGRTRCGTPIGPAFDKQAYLADTSSKGEWTVNGSLLGNTVQLRDVVMTRAKSPEVTGRASLRGVDLGPIARVLRRADAVEGGETAASRVTGQIWGELVLDDVRPGALARSRARLFLGPTLLSRGGQRLALQPPAQPLTLADDAFSMPPLHVTLETPEGFQGGFELTGGVTKLTTDAELSIAARLEPVDLAILQRIVPRVTRASGRAEGSFRMTGKARLPAIAGELHITGDDFEIHGLPGAIGDVAIDVTADATDLAAAGTGTFAGGTVTFHASAPIRGLDVGPLESRVAVHGVHLAPADGVSTTLGADLQVGYDPNGGASSGGALPHVSGDVAIESFSYTRPINLNLDLTSARAKRTMVETYDPALDFVVFDVRTTSKAPLVIKNNLAEVQLGIDSDALEIMGTNQRVGMRGALRALPGGRFHFQSNEFEIQQGIIRFDDPTRIDPSVDITAVTEYRRYGDTSAGAGAGAGAGTGTSAAATASTRGGQMWRITMHAVGDANDVRIQMTSEPALAEQDIVLLLTVGMTRAELDQLQASGVTGGVGGVAINVIGTATGADRAVKQALPIIDDFRFGSAYSTQTGKTEPQLTVGKRLTNDLRASVTAGLTEDREIRSNIEWRLNDRLSLQGSYDNINDATSSTLGNLGVDLRWRLNFE